MPAMTAQHVHDKDKTEPRSRYVNIQGREVHYMEWGVAGAPALVMWHGLARTGRDFDYLAATLAHRFHIVCPDTIGRGLSEWSDRPDEEYCLEAYARLACDVVDAVGFQRLH